MKIEDLFESDLGSRRPAGMFKVHELKIEGILTKYAQGVLSSHETRKELRKLGYDAYPDMRSAWVLNSMRLVDVKTRDLFTIEI